MSLEGLIPSFDRAFDALERRDLDGFAVEVEAIARPDIELHSGIGSVVGGGVYEGPEGVRGWFADLLDIAEEAHWQDRRYEVYGERGILFLCRFELVGLNSGAPIGGENSAFFQFKDGRCFRIDSFMSHAEGREFGKEAIARA